MNITFDLNADVGRMAYVRRIDVTDVPPAVRAQSGELQQLFAICDAEGHQLALASNQKLAYALAVQNDYAPQPLH